MTGRKKKRKSSSLDTKKTYNCLVLSWEDILMECEDDDRLMAKAKRMTDADMRNLSEKIRDICCEEGIFWQIIRDYVDGKWKQK